MQTSKHFLLIITVLLFMACNNENKKEGDQAAAPAEGSFGYDLAFLNKHDSGLVHLQNGSSAILVSPKYQAKVFTSTAAGEEGKSFGWINYKIFSAQLDPHMNGYGGENRLWLGPEGGHYSLFFKAGDSMVFDNWKTPAPVDTEAWDVVKKDDKSVTMQKDMNLQNYTGSTLSLKVERSIAIQNKEEVENELSISLDDSVKFVGYSTMNVLTNTGSAAWTEKTGMPCIWMLDMFNPSPATTIVIPYKPAPLTEKVGTTDYFGEIDSSRIHLTGKTLYYRADGKSRGKLGILPKYALPYAGSYDSESNVLTLISFTLDNNGRYLYQGWNTTHPIFSGDAMNAYNDGPLADGSQMGPFYEIESVSTAADLKPGASIQHKHNVYHFTGSPEYLNKITEKVLGVPLSEIRQAFSNQ